MKFIYFLVSFFIVVNFAFAYTSPGNPVGYINDFAGIVSVDTKQSLESEISNFKKESEHEIVVAIVKNLGGDTIENYTNLLFREWGIGRKDLNNGVLFLVAVDDRQMRIEVGYGLEGVLTDIESKHILDDIVKPYFKSGDYNQGIVAGVKNIREAISGEVMTSNNNQAVKNNAIDDIGEILVWFFGGMIFAASWIASILARSKSWWAGGIIGGLFGLLGFLIIGHWYLVPIGVIVGLFFDYFVSKNYQSGKRSWWAGGNRFGGGSGFGNGRSFGGGGFGGGSSGGGGSSSRW